MFRKNVASQTIGFVAINATTGATMTGTTGFAAYRVIDGGSQASATGSVTDKGNGQYTFALSQADTNGNNISILFTMTGMIAVEKTFVTTACDPTTATNFGITALPTTAVTTNASLLTSGTGTDQVSVSAGKVLLQATQTGVTIPTVTTVTNQLTAAAIATGVWQTTTAGNFTVASSIGKCLYTGNVAPGGSGGLFIAGTNAATTITTALTTTFTGNLTGSVGSVSGAVGSISGVTFPSNFSSFSIDASGRVDIAKIKGTASAGAAGYVGLDWSVINAPTTTVNLSGTTISTSQAVASVSGSVGSVAGNVVGSVGGSVGSVAGSVGSVTDKTGFKLASDGLDTVVIETGCNARQAISVIAAAAAGASSGVAAGSPVYKGVGVATTRISATASDGDRSSVTLSLPT